MSDWEVAFQPDEAMFLAVEAYGVPAPEPRPKWNKQTGASYVPSNANDWKHEVRARVQHAISTLSSMSALPVPGRPWGVTLTFRMPRPKSHWRTGKRSGSLKEWAEVLPHLSKPDIDNLAKAVLDAVGDWDGMLRQIWCDDSQVTRVVASKRYVAPGEEPGATIAFYTVDPS